MPSLEQNIRRWNHTYSWPQHGEEWSEPFGNTDAMWWFALLPRLHRYVPAGTILEIAPGHGRWTQYLRHLCKSLVIVDVSDNCIDTCGKRFADSSNITYVVNDGRSLDAVPDRSIDLVFSFDSLVHCEKDVISDYLRELARTLKPDGVGFIHHSNIGAYSRLLNVFDMLPHHFRVKHAFSRIVSLNVSGGRARSMSAPVFRQLCEEFGLNCITQEVISWNWGRCMIDAISVFTPIASKWCRPCELRLNPQFVDGAFRIKMLSDLYT